VRAGWDNPLQELFCNVEPLDQGGPDRGDGPSCLFQTSYLSVDALVASLGEARISLPQKMIEVIQLDCANSAGNVIRLFQVDGSMQEGQ